MEINGGLRREPNEWRERKSAILAPSQPHGRAPPAVSEMIPETIEERETGGLRDGKEDGRERGS